MGVGVDIDAAHATYGVGHLGGVFDHGANGCSTPARTAAERKKGHNQQTVDENL